LELKEIIELLELIAIAYTCIIGKYINLILCEAPVKILGLINSDYNFILHPSEKIKRSMVILFAT